MRSLLVIALAGCSPSFLAGAGGPSVGRFSNGPGSFRSNSTVDLNHPLLEFAPPSGAGMGTECSGLVPTGSRGETLTFTRASIATCTKADGTVVDLTSGQPAVQVAPYTGTGALGLVVELAGTNIVTNSNPAAAVVWTDIGTGSIVDNVFDGPKGRGTMPRITCAAAGDGRQAVIATTGESRKAFSVWLHAGTASAVTLSIAGTGNSAGDRSRNFTAPAGFGRVGVVTTAAYAAGITAITVQVKCNGVTGTFGADLAQVEEDSAGYGANFSVSSFIPTSGSTQTRALVTAQLARPTGLRNSLGCGGASVYLKQWDTEDVFFLPIVFNADGRPGYFASLTSAREFDGTNVATLPVSSIAGVTTRIIGSWTGVASTMTVSVGSESATGTYDGSMSAESGTIQMGNHASSTNASWGWVSNLTVDDSPGRCLDGFTPDFTTVAFIGDSLTARVDIPLPAPNAYAGITGRTVHKYSISSAPWDDVGPPAGCKQQWSTSGVAPDELLVIICGINTIDAGGDGSTLLTDYLSFVHLWRSRGVRVVATTITPFKGASGWSVADEVQRDAFNSGLRSWCAANPPCADLDATLRNNSGDVDTLASAFDEGDHEHWTQAAATAVALAVATVTP